MARNIGPGNIHISNPHYDRSPLVSRSLETRTKTRCFYSFAGFLWCPPFPFFKRTQTYTRYSSPEVACRPNSPSVLIERLMFLGRGWSHDTWSGFRARLLSPIRMRNYYKAKTLLLCFVDPTVKKIRDGVSSGLEFFAELSACVYVCVCVYLPAYPRVCITNF